MINIPYLQTNGLNCFEACHILLCNYINKEYAAVFHNILDFTFDSRKYQHTKHWDTCMKWPFTIENNMKDLYGFKLCHRYYCRKQKVAEAVRSSLQQEMPIVLRTSTYYCPWLKEYKIKDLLRFVIITHYNKANQSYQILDPASKKSEIFQIDIRQLPPGMILLSSITQHDFSINPMELKRMAYKHLSTLHIEKSFSSCMEVIQKRTFLQEKTTETQYYQWNIGYDVLFFEKLAHSCLYFREFLFYLQNHLNNKIVFIDEGKELSSLYKQWILFRNVLVRYKRQDLFLQVHRDNLCRLLKSIHAAYRQLIDSLLLKLNE